MTSHPNPAVPQNAEPAERPASLFSIWTDRVRDGGLYLLALSLFLAPAGLAAGLFLVWLGFAMTVADRRPLPRGPAIWLAVAVGLYYLARGLSAGLVEDGAGPHWDATFKWAQLFVFVPVAVALRADQQKLLRLLLLALIGLLLGILWRLDWALLTSDLSAFATSRPGFGFPTIVFALFAGTALLGLLLLRDRCWADRAGIAKAGLGILWGGAVLGLVQVFVLTLSRGAWIALLGTLIAAIWLIRRDRHDKPSRTRSPATWLAIAIVAAVIVVNGGQILERASDEWDDLRTVIATDSAEQPVSSLTLRWHAHGFGIELWREKPWHGWGPGTSQTLMAQSGHPGVIVEADHVLRHLHNTYLEILVQFGLVGLALWIALIATLLYSVRTAVVRGSLAPDLGRFLLLALWFVALWSLFEYHAQSQPWRGYWALLAGAALSFGLAHRSPARSR